MNIEQENCFKCGEVIDFQNDSFTFDMDKLDYVHEKCKHKKKCDYCDEYVEQTKLSPYMADASIGSEMCEECWNVTRPLGFDSEGIDIGDFNK